MHAVCFRSYYYKGLQIMTETVPGFNIIVTGLFSCMPCGYVRMVQCVSVSLIQHYSCASLPASINRADRLAACPFLQQCGRLPLHSDVLPDRNNIIYRMRPFQVL